MGAVAGGEGGKGVWGPVAALHWGGRALNAPTALRCAVLRPHRQTRCVRFALCAQTVAMSMMTNALRAGRKPCAPRRPRRRATPDPHTPLPPGSWCSDCRSPDFPAGAPIHCAGVAGGCAALLEVFAHAAESRAQALVVAPAPWRAATASARDCKQRGADARHAGPGRRAAPADVPVPATGRKQAPKLAQQRCWPTETDACQAAGSWLMRSTMSRRVL